MRREPVWKREPIWTMIWITIGTLVVLGLIQCSQSFGAATVTLTMTEPLVSLPGPLIYELDSGATMEIELSGEVPGIIFTGNLPELPTGTCGAFSLPPNNLCDAAGNCGNEIISGADYCVPEILPTPTPADWQIAGNFGWKYSDGIFSATHEYWPGHDSFWYESTWLPSTCTDGICLAYHQVLLNPGDMIDLAYKYKSDGTFLYDEEQIEFSPQPSPTPTEIPEPTPTPDIIAPSVRIEVIE